MKPRIAYILSLFPTIYETFILNEILELKRLGVDIYIFSLKTPGKIKCPKEAKEIINFTFYTSFLFSGKLFLAQIYFLTSVFGDYFGILFNIIKTNFFHPNILIKSLAIFPKSVYFAKIIKELNIERIHAHFVSIPATSAMIISWLLKIPFSCTAHGSDIYQYLPPDIARRIREANPFVTVSEYNKRYLSRYVPEISKDKIKVVHCGLDLQKFIPMEEKNNDKILRILNVARLEKVKGHVYLIEACRLLKKKGVNFDCQIVGDGSQKQRLKNLIYQYRLESNVFLEEEVLPEKIISFYREADIFVLPSLREGIPVSAMEAMAMNLPVVATKVYGIPELVEDGKEGILVPARDAENLARAITSLIADSRLRNRLSQGCRLKIKQEFDVAKNCQKLYEYFGRLSV